MWDSHLFNRANPKPLVLAQAVKLCHYTRAFQRPSAEGSSLWETVYPLLHVLLSGVSCNVTFRVTWGSRLEKYRCCSRSEGQQWCERSSKAKPQNSPWCCRADVWPPLPPPYAAGSVCFLCTEKERRKKSTCDAKDKDYKDLRKKIIQSLQLKNSGCTLEMTFHLARMFWSSDKTRKKSMHTWCFVFIIIFM